MSNNSENEVGKDASDPNRAIGDKLRSYYDSVQEEPIPERFLDLLERLEEAEEKAAVEKNEE